MSSPSIASIPRAPRSRVRRRRACLAASLLLTLVACGGGGGDENGGGGGGGGGGPVTPPATRPLTLAPTGPANAGVLRVGQASCPVGQNCASDHPAGATVTITAEPAATFEFRTWGGACAGTSGPSCTVTMSDARTVSAEFGSAPVLAAQRLSLALTGTSGRVVSTPAGIDCSVIVEETSGSCAADFPAGSTVQLQATGIASSTLGGWSGACSGNAAACSVTMSAARSVGAQWVGGGAGLVRVSPSGTGIVRLVSTPAGIDCSRDGRRNDGTCAVRLRPGTSVTVTGTTERFSIFTTVTGSCTALPCTLTSAPDGERGISVGTRYDAFTLTIALDQPNMTGTARIVSRPAGIDCLVVQGSASGTCTAPMQARDGIRIQTTLDPGHNWMRYLSGCNADNICDFVHTSDRTVVVSIWRRQPTFVSASPSTVDDGDGAVRSGDGRIDCTKQGNQVTGRCSWDEADTVDIVVEAIPAPGSRFVQWNFAPCGTNPICPRRVGGLNGARMTAIFRRN